MVEYEIPDESGPLFDAGRLPLDVLQLTIKGMIRPAISERILIPVPVFIIDIFALKITEIQSVLFKAAKNVIL